MTPRAARAVFAATMAVAIAIRLVLVFLTPYGHLVRNRLEGLNDEPAHMNYIRALATTHRFPVQTHHAAEPGAFDRADFEYYQPPLAHLIDVPVVWIAGTHAILACRLVSFVFGLLTLLVLDRVLGRLGGSTTVRRLGVAFLALLPVHAYFTSLISNDALTWLIAFLLTHQLLVLLSGAGGSASGFRPWIHVRLGLLLGAGLLVKSSIVMFVPLIVLADAWIAWTSRRAGRMAGSVVALAIGAAIAAPWYARNLAVYHSLFALQVGFGPPLAGRSSVTSLAQTLIGTVRYFWMPMAHIPGGPWVHDLRAFSAGLLILHAVAALIWLRRAGAALQVDHAGAALQVDHAGAALQVDHAAWDAGLALLVASFVAAAAAQIALNLHWAEAEGRFLLPAAPAIVLFIVQPTVAVCGRLRNGDAVAWAWVTALALHPYLLLLFV